MRNLHIALDDVKIKSPYGWRRRGNSGREREDKEKIMRIVLIGSRYFGLEIFKMLQAETVDIAKVIVPQVPDRLQDAAASAAIPLEVQADPLKLPADMIPAGVDLLITAHSHARVANDALAKARLGGIGYHPSLLPRHRGMAAVEWTVKEGDAIAGGSIYHLAERMDAGPVAMQEWCFVKKGETARELWERALAPMGIALMRRVVRHALAHGTIPAHPQDEQFATKAPLLKG